MNQKEINKIMDNIMEDGNLCIIRNALENFESEKTELTIKFNTKIDTEKVRECLEDNLGVEILEIEGGLKWKWNKKN